MKRCKGIVLAVGLVVTALAGGCQTQNPETGLTLPTGWYLRHVPQYFPPTPDYPLPRETYALEEASAREAETLRGQRLP
jgi:hypothetical protein